MNAECGLRNAESKNVASAFIANKVSILKDHENVYYFLLTNNIIMCHFVVKQEGHEVIYYEI